MELNKIYCENCLDTMARMPDNFVDMIFADPPFNVGKKYNGYKDDVKDYFGWQEQWIKECFRVLKNTGTFYLMTLDRNLPNTLYSMAKYGYFINLIKWRNVSASHNKRSFWMSSQPIAMYGKTEQYIFNTYAETRETFKAWDKKRDERMKGQLLDYWDDIPFVYAGSIVHKEAILKPATKQKLHLAQMPEQLPGRAILFSTNENDLVYDPFMGSGTTAIASYKLKRNYIGSEISSEYCDMANKRIKEYAESILF